jgi:hypothetical protein
MLTKKIADFSADLLDTVRGVLGEAKKCPADCECEKCEAEEDDEDEMKEGHVPTADEPTDANKKTAQKIRDMMAKEKKPVKEDAEQIDETAKIVAHLQKRYGDNIRKSHVRSAASDFGVDASKLAKAVRAKLGKNMLGEEEQIDEISSDMAHRYLKGKRERDYDISPDGKSSKLKKPQSFDKMNKDMKSTVRALKTIEKAKKANEDVEHTNCGTPDCCGQCDTAESINEISKGTLGRYINKAKDSIDTASYRQGHKEAHGSSSKPLEKKLTKRHKGISTAVNKLTKEEAEQIDELSSKTLFSYGKKARKEAEKRDEPMHRARGRLLASKKTNPARGGYKLTKVAATFGEEAEQIDELSKKTLGSYIEKGARNLAGHGITAGAEYEKGNEPKRQWRKIDNREKGIATAASKLTKEEQDFIDALNNDMFEEVEITEARGRPKKAGAKDFTIHPRTKEKLMHNNPEHMKKIEALQKNKVLEKPKVEAGQHIMNQLSKAKTSMLGGSTIHFTHGDSKHVSGTHAAKLLTKYAGMKPSEKEDFQKKIGHSHEQLMKHV